MRLGILVALLSWSSFAHAEHAPPQSNVPLSNRIVRYNIDATYDPKTHTLEATEILTYKNQTGQPLSVFPFHLYLNGFQPNSSFTREAHRDYRNEEWKSSYLGSIEIKKLEVVGQGDLTSRLQFVAPDDHNPDDRTVAQVQLHERLLRESQLSSAFSSRTSFPR